MGMDSLEDEASRGRNITPTPVDDDISMGIFASYQNPVLVMF